MMAQGEEINPAPSNCRPSFGTKSEVGAPAQKRDYFGAEKKDANSGRDCSMKCMEYGALKWNRLCDLKLGSGSRSRTDLQSRIGRGERDAGAGSKRSTSYSRWWLAQMGPQLTPQSQVSNPSAEDSNDTMDSTPYRHGP